MEKTALFFDIDGTLLAGGIPGYFPEGNIRALDEARRRGRLLFINTGRAFSYLPVPIKDYPFDGYLCGCGTHILIQKEDGNVRAGENRYQEIHKRLIPDDLKYRIIDLLEETGIQAVLEGPDHMFWDSRIDHLPLMEKLADSCRFIGPDVLKDQHDPGLSFNKLAIVYDSGADVDTFYARMGEVFDRVTGLDLDSYSYEEFVPKGYSKATAIDLVADHFGLSLDHCFVFGDGTNDLPMIRHVKHSIAMGNGHPEVLARASYVTAPVNRDGLRLAMEHFGII